MASELWHQNLDAVVNIAEGILSEVEEMHWPRRVAVLAEAIIELAKTYPDGCRVSDVS